MSGEWRERKDEGGGDVSHAGAQGGEEAATDGVEAIKGLVHGTKVLGASWDAHDEGEDIEGGMLLCGRASPAALD